MATNPLLQLNALGQSVWCDNIRRGLIAGELADQIRAGEITGLTSNPSIFEKAIAGSTDYDAALEPLARAGTSANEIFDSLAIEDIRAVADLLLPVYERTSGRDGYVSLEVSPLLANQLDASVKEARRLFRAVDRRNAMIKIPGTPEGIPAFEQATYEGININVTLLFSIEAYEQVAESYLRALERRATDGRAIDGIGSVASFFVSRVDTAVDAILEEKVKGGASSLHDLLGKTAVANAKLAYQSFKQIFSGPRWQALAARGAQVQRPLWGSTSTKNPAYSDVLYVEELIGPNTVNTMPPATIDAFRDHGVATETIERDVEAAREVFRRLEAAGVDLAAVTLKLQLDGVRAFADSFDALIAAVEAKRLALSTVGTR